MTYDKSTIETPYLKRTIFPQITTLWTRGSLDDNLLPHHHKGRWGVPFEAAVKRDGKWQEISSPERVNQLWGPIDKTFAFQDCTTSQDDQAATWSLTFTSAQLKVVITYRAALNLPHLEKSVAVTNIHTQPLCVQNICVESIFDIRYRRALHLVDDYRMNTIMPDPVYCNYLRSQFPMDVNVTLKPGETLESYRLHEIFSDNTRQQASYNLSRVIRNLAPWATAPRIKFQMTNLIPGDDPVAQIKERILHCSQAGIEDFSFFLDQLWTNIGDYELRKDILPNGLNDLRELIDYAHGLGLRVGTYCSYSIAWLQSKVRLQHLDWECTAENGTTYDPGTYGNMCLLSPWADYIADKIQQLIKDFGFDYLDFDGPTDIPCHTVGHDHRSLGEFHYLSWQWEKKLFKKLRDQNITCTIPRSLNYILMGANRICGGYCEEDFCHSEGLELLKNYRSSIARSREERPGLVSWGFLSLDHYHGHGIHFDEQHVEQLEQGLAGLFMFGNTSFITGNDCGKGEITRAIIRKWTDAYRQYRDWFTGDCLIVSEPHGNHVEATMFVSPKHEDVLLCLLNPTAEQLTEHILLPAPVPAEHSLLTVSLAPYQCKLKLLH